MKRAAILHPLVVLCGHPQDLSLLGEILDHLDAGPNPVKHPLALGLVVPAGLFVPAESRLLLPRLRALQDAGRLSILTSGLMTVIGDLQTPLELDANARFAHSNPWGCGFTDLGVQCPPTPVAVWPSSATMTQEMICALRHDGLDYLSLPPPVSRYMPLYRSIAELEHGRGDGFLVLDGPAVRAGELEHLERWATLHQCLTVADSQRVGAPNTAPARGQAIPLLPLPSGTSPDFATGLARLGELRTHSDDASLRRRLEAVSPALPHPADSGPLDEGPGRNLLAAMPGQVQMPAGSYDILLRHGRLLGFRQGKARLDCAFPPSTLPGKGPCRWEAAGAISVDGPGVRGLRDSRVCQLDRQRTVISTVEYLLQEGSDYLFLNMELRFPTMATDAPPMDLVPWRLGFVTSGTVQVSWESARGTCHQELAPLRHESLVQRMIQGERQGAWLHCYGKDWLIRSGKHKLALRLPEGPEAMAPLSLRLVDCPAGIALEILPQGFWSGVPASSLSRRVHRASLAMLPAFDSDQTLPGIPPMAGRELFKTTSTLLED